jgi:phosphate transport system permease protein
MMAIFGEAGKFFKLIAWQEFFFGTKWNPQLAMNSGQEVAKSSFGAVPVFLGTILITLVAMFIAVPIGIMGAVNLTLYCKSSTRDLLKPILEILAGIPTVVYGYFAVIFIAPIFKLFFGFLNIEIASESALSAGFVMGIMIIPFILSLTDDAINSVPKSLYDGALAMGSTNYEMISKVIIPSAMPAIIGSIILAVSRAIGETMIVVMSAGLLAKMTFNPLDSATTATAQIVSLLSGDQEFSSSKTLASFALALTLFVVTFIFNILALIVIKKYQKKNG